MGAHIDLNADLGESFGQWHMGADDELLDVVSSANVACGFHAGDPLVMRTTLTKAAERGVRVGAHVAYRDLAGFGRVFVDVEPERLTAEILYQLGAITSLARVCGTRVAYVKPHGALYNTIVHHEQQARAVVEALVAHNASLSDGDAPLALMGLPGSLAGRQAREAGLTTLVEAFADRAYQPDGTLTPRRHPGAVLHDPAAISERVLRLVTDGVVEAVDGSLVEMRPDSVCVHGDNPAAVDVARTLRRDLEAAGITVSAGDAGSRP